MTFYFHCGKVLNVKRFKAITEGKRPADATPERALELSKTLSQVEIARLWDISRQRVNQLIKRAKAG